jgi:hypothetical protein
VGMTIGVDDIGVCVRVVKQTWIVEVEVEPEADG